MFPFSDAFSVLVIRRKRAAEIKQPRVGRNRCGEEKGVSVLVCFCSFSKSKSHTSLFSVDKKGWWLAAGGDVAASLLYVTPQRPLLWTQHVLGRDVVATGPPWT